jgi:hypothetical protein
MPATEPEQIHGLCEQAFNAGDLEALVALYEPDAALIPQPGTMAEGTAAIRDSVRWFPDRGGRITLDTKLVVRVGDGHHGRGGPPAVRLHLALCDRQCVGRPGGHLRIGDGSPTSAARGASSPLSAVATNEMPRPRARAEENEPKIGIDVVRGHRAPMLCRHGPRAARVAQARSHRRRF